MEHWTTQPREPKGSGKGGQWKSDKLEAAERIYDSKYASGVKMTHDEEENIPVTVLNEKISNILEGKYGMLNNDVIILKSRYETHIKTGMNSHRNIYDHIKNDLGEYINNPDYIFEDTKNKNTVLFVSKVKQPSIFDNADIVIKLNCEQKEYSNTILTIIDLGNNRLENFKNNKKIVYKK